MTSILTNVAAMSALQTLRSIGSNMEETQGRVSSGMRVGTASDNAAYWSIATTMRSDNMALSAVQDALGLGAAKVDTAYAGMESAIEVVKEIKAKLVAATEDGVDKAKIQEEIDQLQDQLVSISQAASFSGENWLQTDLTAASGSEMKSIVGSFVRDEAGNVSVKKVDYELSTSTVLFDTGGDTGILDQVRDISGPSATLNINVGGVTSPVTVKSFTTDDIIASGLGASTFDGSYANDGTDNYVKVADNTWVLAVDQSTVPDQEVVYTDSSAGLWAVDIPGGQAALAATAVEQSVDNLDITAITTAEQLGNLIQMVDDALTMMTSAAADLGSITMRIDLQGDFVKKLTESIDKGVGRLVDADMNEESTRLKALQTQQQLAIQSLSIANSASESILTLFR
ncbi:flagellin [Shinella yambaruensis]|uniref:Flagellin n=1 Tax=Shinella yambaruensis TaxID=415996 RepID=A0ABQ5ZBM0_9HYPH|nr:MULTISPECIES: flagellin [Shinella]CAI0340929.1 Flagellin B [Rhizobiaceae bacterium]CAK7259274.1 Flagellin B [Shinella sp. WSC3-e]MCJ8026130.1 flagellin [Shinella yambaruensis]MCO5136883.1 flagellin [Shinella sp.]MCU7978148.1 flagellin [Shinella yambaruensis]